MATPLFFEKPGVWCGDKPCVCLPEQKIRFSERKALLVKVFIAFLAIKLVVKALTVLCRPGYQAPLPHLCRTLAAMAGHRSIKMHP